MTSSPERIGNCTMYLGDCSEILLQVPENSIDACITDPPAGIGFMGKAWDTFKDGGKNANWNAPDPKNRTGNQWQPGTEIGHTVRSRRCKKCGKQSWSGSPCTCSEPEWDNSATREAREAFISWLTGIMEQVYRVLKPGAHALVWALPRTSHWTAMACEDAGFEIRDRVSHLFGTGFPKSLSVSKAIDKMAGAEREIVGITQHPDGNPRTLVNRNNGIYNGGHTQNGIGLPVTTPATEDAQQWDGWGTALKPAMEDWWLCRKPFSETTVAKNILRWGTGALNIDACRIAGENWGTRPRYRLTSKGVHGGSFGNPSAPKQERLDEDNECISGRWPANCTHDGSQEILEQFPITSSNSGGPFSAKKEQRHSYGTFQPREEEGYYGDTGSAARFFFCAKASPEDRGKENIHPTVKNTHLMRWLIRLITPPSGVILDPFMGSGSTGKAAILEEKSFFGIEQVEEYYAIAKQRIIAASEQPSLFA